MENVADVIEKFILDNLLYGDDGRMPDRNESLLEAGLIDSTGILELIEFLEQEFEIRIDDTETTPANLDGIGRLAEFVQRKRAANVD